MAIEFPAPEEARSYKDYVAIFRARNPGEDFKAACAKRGGDHKAFFDWSWKQPEAEAIHRAYA